MYADLLAQGLVSVHDVQAKCAQTDLVGVTGFFDIAHAIRMDVLLCPSGESIDECEISFLYTTCRYVEVLLRSVRYVVRGIWRRIVVLVGIDAEHREVTGMPRPHPVVCVASEFSYR